MSTTRWTAWAAALALVAAGCSDPGGGGAGGAPADTAAGGGDATSDAGGDGAALDAEDDAAPGPDGAIGDADGDGSAVGPDGTEDAIEDALEDAVAPDGSAPDAADDAADAGPPPDTIPAPDVVAPFSHCSPPGGSRNVYDLQDPQCPDHFWPEPVGTPGQLVDLAGVVVTGVFGDTVFVQETPGGPYSGIAVFFHGVWTGAVAVGDVLDVTGFYSEYFQASQVYLESYEIVGEAEAPEPFVPDHPFHLSTNGPIPELFEGVLVRVLDVETTHTRPDCPNDFGEFEVTGGLRVDDMGFKWKAHLGDAFASITGPLHYTFGNYKIEPRDEADVVVVSAGGAGAISKCIKGECIAAETAPVTHQVVVNELMIDPYGADGPQEWIELHNPGAAPVDLNGWVLRDCAVQKLPLAGPAAVIPAGGYLVLGAEGNPTLNGGVPVDVAYGQQAFYLPNTVGAVLLYDPAGVLVDHTRYSAFEPWTVLEAGASLERVSPTSDGTQPEAWRTGTEPFGAGENRGTPGAPNTP